MNSLIAFYLKNLRRVQVVHRLPGRLRVKVPGLQGSGECVAPYQAVFEEALAAVPGVLAVRGNPLTGTVLVNYDAAVTGEGAIREWLDRAWERVVALLQYCDREDIADEGQIQGLLREALSS